MTERIREPGYRAGRFFLSPMLGCSARCAFCYIFSFGYRDRAGQPNGYGVDASIDWIVRHPDFVEGRSGSIISIGAWGDPFPPDEESRAHTLIWVQRACALGNPVQLMSRFELPPELVDKVVGQLAYDGQLLFSTSLSTVENAAVLEKNADGPERRLVTLSRFRHRGVPTNVMIKPFILGVTDRESGSILNLLRRYGVDLCVVGELYWDQRIGRATVALGHVGEGATRIMAAEGREGHVLDCEPEASLMSLPSAHLDSFIAELWEGGVAAFKKSACVNSYAAGLDLGLRDRPEYSAYCVECGACESSTRRSPATVIQSSPRRMFVKITSDPRPGIYSEGVPTQGSGARSARAGRGLTAAAVQTLQRWHSPDAIDAGVRDVFVDFLTCHPAPVERQSSPAHVTASAVVLDSKAESVFLVLHRKVGRWLQPGGHCELGDINLAAAAIREAEEETGLVGLRLADDEVLDCDIHAAPCRDDPKLSHYDVRFLAIADLDGGTPRRREVIDARWFRLSGLPDDLDSATRRLIAKAVEAFGRGGGRRSRD
ncbi:MAG TPA: NUDIX domain-containing protein [Frankiaceae bacterium]|jgi:DNA repair photolyase/8-oxo-dGTP pyrophosphatase MutT (NUDIX family)|nr:NUDIX domain-containing protein [Frankiaceae bacterium]